MRLTLVVAVLLLSTSGHAADAPRRQSGVLLQMDSVQCEPSQGSTASGGTTLVATATPNNIQASFCQEYVLQSDRVTFHIRPRDTRHAVLLPIGGIALFRLQQGRMILRAADLDDKDREYSVISMTPRETPKTPESPLPKLNHLQ